MEDKFVLSIVMCSIPERAQSFNKLRTEVKRQIDYCNNRHRTLGRTEIVDVITQSVLNGGISIGAKRQEGLNRAQGKYVCWLDDDDWVSPDYVETLLRLAIADADTLVFNNISIFPEFWCLVQMNLDFIQDEQVFPGIVHRRPYHVCGFRRSILKDCIFPDANWDEDTAFLSQVWPKLKSQAKTEAILHEYNRLTESFSKNNEKMRG